MASPDNLASMEPWTYRPPFADSWISEAFARDTETLTKALQKSLSNNNHHSSSAADSTISSFFAPPSVIPMTIKTQQGGGGGSGSDPETPASTTKRWIPVSGGGVGKAAKRKSRASNRTTTTYITADPANFRQMVQQVTGVKFPGGNSQVLSPVLLKPEPQRPSANNRVLQGQGCLPTLDTSAFLLDLHRQQPVLATSAAAAASVQPPLAALSPPVYADFDSFSSFPTLESCSF